MAMIPVGKSLDSGSEKLITFWQSIVGEAGKEVLPPPNVNATLVTDELLYLALCHVANELAMTVEAVTPPFSTTFAGVLVVRKFRFQVILGLEPGHMAFA
jgi:hypothetical protein